MDLIQTLSSSGQIRMLLGKVEIETIIKRINGKKLKQTERNYLSRSIRPKLAGAYILCEEKILEKIVRPKKSNINDEIIANLSFYGYDLISIYKTKIEAKMDLYELISRILTQEQSPRLIESIPILFLKNKIDTFALLDIAAKNGIKNKIGYLLETAFIISDRFNMKNIKYLKGLLSHLEKTKDPEICFLAEAQDDEEYVDFLKRTSSKRIKKWNLLGRFFDEDFMKIAGGYL